MLIKYNGTAVNFTAKCGCFEANTFGKSSEKIRIIIVIKIIWIVRITFIFRSYKDAISSAMDTETMDVATFANVFPTRIVTSNRRGKAIKLFAYLEMSSEDLKSSSKFFCLIEKNATSDPEKNAERANNNTSETT